MKSRITTFILVLLSLLLLVTSAAAQHPIDIQRNAAEGEYFKALINYDKLPKRRATTLSIIAAARSAWGLSLPARAISEYDKALKDEKLDSTERARILLSRSIIEFQEDRYQVAQLFAEKALALLPNPSLLRSKVWFVWAQSLDKLGMYGAAEEQYKKAISESSEDEQGDIYFLLGSCQLRLGKSEDARESLQKVPIRHLQAPHAIRLLAELSLKAGRTDEVEFWLNTGRKEYAESFLDSWVDYAMAKVAISRKDEAKLKDIIEEAAKKYPPSDHWLNLLNSSVEAYRWQQGINEQENKQ